jgi:hypothetical protein
MMTDPFSISTGIISVLQLAQTIGLYLCAVKGASEDCRLLLQEVNTIRGLLCQLNDLEKEVEYDNTWARAFKLLSVPNGPLDHLKRALENLQSKLGPYPEKGRFRQTILWPFQKSEVTEILFEIERLKSYFLFALQNDQTSLVRAMKSDITNLSHEVNNVGKDVAQLLDSQKAMSNLTVAQQLEESQRRLDIERQSTILWITSLSFKIDHEQLLEAWVPDTAAWIFFHDLYRDWHQSPHSRFLCVQGNAGCGKSMLASRVIESITTEIAQYRGQSLAYVYCKSRSLPQKAADNLIASLLQQLCLHTPTLDDAVLQLRERYRYSPTDPPAFRELMKALFSTLKSFHRSYFVIDGLDECDDPVKFASALQEIRQLPNLSAKVIIFCRPTYQHWEDIFRNEPKISIDSDLNRTDIETFTHVRLAALAQEDSLLFDDGLRAEVAKALIDKADGMKVATRHFLRDIR